MKKMRQKNAGEGAPPAICVPLVGRTKEEIADELAEVLNKKPDMLEWRADFFRGIGVTEAVLAIAAFITGAAPEMPVIFTVRSEREGGQAIHLSDKEAITLCAAVCVHTAIRYVDCELSNEPEQIQYLRDIAHQNGKKIIASFHQHQYTPAREFLLEKLAEAQAMGLDSAKIAVMPCSMEDVITLLSVSLEANRQLQIPIVIIAMGKYGVITRIAGGIFGSALTFAVGSSSSAPGQIPIEDLQAMLHAIEKSMK